MADKIQKIREKVEKKLEVMQYQIHRKDAYKELKCVLDYIDSMQEEPVSKDLEEAAKHYLYSNILYDDVYVGNPTDKDCIEMFKAGAEWQKKRMLEKAIDAELYSDGMFVPLIGFKDKEKVSDIKFGDKVKVIIIKEG